MNIDEQAAAKQLQALFEETNKAVKGNWIAPELADIVKILQDNQKGGDASCSNESKITSTTSAQSGNAAPTVQAAGAAEHFNISEKDALWQVWNYVPRFSHVLCHPKTGYDIWLHDLVGIALGIHTAGAAQPKPES